MPSQSYITITGIANLSKLSPEQLEEICQTIYNLVEEAVCDAIPGNCELHLIVNHRSDRE